MAIVPLPKVGLDGNEVFEAYRRGLDGLRLVLPHLVTLPMLLSRYELNQQNFHATQWCVDQGLTVLILQQQDGELVYDDTASFYNISIVSFLFRDANTAMMFKLAWGGA